MEINFNSSKELYDFLDKISSITYCVDLSTIDNSPISGDIGIVVDNHKINLAIRVKDVPKDADSEQSSQAVTDGCVTNATDYRLDMLYGPKGF